MGIVGIVILVLVNVPTNIVLGWLFFGNWAGFVDAIGVCLTKDSEFDVEEEERPEIFLNGLRVLGFAVSVAVLIYAEYRLIVYLVPG
jgi:hypothetical protein